MKLSIKKLFSAFILINVMALTGCNGGPSEGEINSALHAELEKQLAPMKQLSKMMGIEEEMKPENFLMNVTSYGCEAVENRENYFKCDVEVTAKDPITKKEETNRDFLVMIKTESGEWKVDK